jgi:hypothetical protein
MFVNNSNIPAEELNNGAEDEAAYDDKEQGMQNQEESQEQEYDEDN